MSTNMRSLSSGESFIRLDADAPIHGLLLSWFCTGTHAPSGIGLLTFLLIFTGFGLFVGFLTPPLLIVEAVQALRARERGRAVLVRERWRSHASAGAFLRVATPSNLLWRGSGSLMNPLEYVVFVGRMLGNFYGTAVLSAWELILGLVVSRRFLPFAPGTAFAVCRGVLPRIARASCFSVCRHLPFFFAQTAHWEGIHGRDRPLARAMCRS